MNNKRFKHFLLAAFLSAGALNAPIITQPAMAQTQIESMQDMAGWMQSITTIQVDIMSLFSADSMENIYSILNTGDVESIKRFGQQFEAERQVVLARATQQIDSLEPPEKWNVDRSLFSNQDRAIYSAAKTQFEGLGETYSLFDTLTKSLSDILNNPDDLDDDGLEELLSVQYQSSVKLIELENRQLDGYILAIPKNNPNHQLQKIIKQFNLAGISELNITMFDNSLDERQANGEELGEHLSKIRSLIREGQKNARNSIRQIKQLDPTILSSTERLMLPITINVYENLGEAFEVEMKLLESMESSYALYTSDKTDSEIESLIEANDLDYFRLTESRATLMQQRLSLLQ